MCFKREVYSNTRKIPNKQSNVTPKETKKEQTKSKGSRSKEIIKIRAGINEIEMEKITKTKIWFFEKINKIDKPTAKLIKKKWERTQIKMEKEKLQLTQQKYKRP